MAERAWRVVTGTVRFRVTAWAAVVLILGLTATSIVLVTVVRRDLVRGVDVELDRVADSIEAVAADPERLAADLAARPGDEWFAQVVQDGSVVAASPPVAGLAPLASFADRGARPFDMEVPLDDPSFRVVARPVGDREIIVGRTLDEVRDGVAVLSSALLIGVPLLTLGLAVLVWTLVGRTLRPVEAIREEVAALGGGHDLHRRVPEPETRDEIARLATTMNEMLARIEASTERQRTFVADASHELRIPLTRIRTLLEVDGDDAPADHLLADIGELQKLVDDLLFLARADAGRQPVHRARLDLDELVRDEARKFESSAIELRLAPVMVEGDPGDLGRAIRNLIDNAVRHASQRVVVQLEERDGEAVLSVTDDGPGISAEHQAEVFERFTRLDEARGSDAGGAGLGLAIVKSIVERHAGSVTIEDALPGARFSVRFAAVS